MITKTLKLSEILPYDNNPRDNSESVLKVKESIKHFGYKQPIIVDSNNVVIAGHTRLEALKSLNNEGLFPDTVTVIVASDLTESQVRAYRLADNKVSEFSDWDYGLLANEIVAIGQDFDMSLFGFEDFLTVQDELPVVDDEPAKESVTIKFGTELIRVYKDDYDKWVESFQLTTGKSIYEYLMQDMGLLTIKRNYDLSGA
jgi:hypothetical protein